MTLQRPRWPALVLAAGTALMAADAAAAPFACKSRLQGSGVAKGVLGAGTAKARAAAIENWETAAGIAHGARYADFGKADEVRWDCTSGPLRAKCLVTARACR